VKERYRDGERDKVNKTRLRVRKRVEGRGAKEKRDRKRIEIKRDRRRIEMKRDRKRQELKRDIKR